MVAAISRWSLGLVASSVVLAAALAQPAAPPTAPPMTPGGSGPGAAPKPADAPDSLEKALAEALKNNPDVRLAEAKLREAEAELDRARMQVMQKLVSLRASLAKQKAEVDHAGKVFERMTDLARKNAVDATIVDETALKLQVAKQKLAELQSEYDFLTGKHQARLRVYPLLGATHLKVQLPFDPTAVGVERQVTLNVKYPPEPAGSPTAKLRKALDQRITLDYQEVPLAEVVKAFQQQHGVPFVLATKALGETKVTLQLREASFGAALEMLEDTLPGVHFAVRDYGVLVTSAERVPPGAVPVQTFWKTAQKKETRDDPMGKPR